MLRSNWERNKLLIDLTQIPKEIEDKIINTYESIQTKPIEPMNVMKFCSKHHLQKILATWNTTGQIIKTLN